METRPGLETLCDFALERRRLLGTNKLAAQCREKWIRPRAGPGQPG